MTNIETQPLKPFEFSVLKLLKVVVVICLLCALAPPAIPRAPNESSERKCMNNLTRIGIALSNYHDLHGCFPAPFSVDASGKPLHSWRVAIEPFLRSSDVHSTFNYTLPWNDPKNLKASLPYAHCFACPSARQPFFGGVFTNYVMVVGQKRSASSDPLHAIIVVEIADSDIHWTEPRDLSFNEMSFTINDKTKPSISSHHFHGAMVLYTDGGVPYLDESIRPDELKAMLTQNLEDASGRPYSSVR
jgi:hypothetical protein